MMWIITGLAGLIVLMSLVQLVFIIRFALKRKVWDKWLQFTQINMFASAVLIVLVAYATIFGPL